MKLSIKLGSAWTMVPRAYTRDEAISLLRASKVPARMINAETGAIVAAKVL